MNGPTPVSALIHAATMVTAGVYLIARLAFLYAQSLTAMAVVATVGAATALFGALLAFAQNDIKKVLAYSTISQLGFMVMAVGLGAWWQGFFHLVTHAFFKACLFLGAGSVILACHHEQDIRRLGGLRKRLPQTTITFLIATLAITGVAPLSGFFSKEAILHFAHAAAPAGLQGLAHVLAFVGMLAALCTAFYMFRLYFLVFEGEPRSEKAANAAEQRPTITVPLWILAGLSIVALIWGWPWKPFALPTLADGGLEPILQNFLSPVFRNAAFTLGIGPVAGGKGLLVAMGIAWAIALAGLLFAFLVYRCGGRTLLSPLIDRGPGRWIRVAVSRAFFVDEICHYVLVVPFRIVSKLAFHLIDDALIDGLLVRGTGRVTAWSGRVLRRLQNGDVQRYAAVMALGAVVTLAVAMGIWTDLASFFTGAH
jgi:NADH-quinone oxidoreductase subunit L